jgi:general secretion pathway protein B
MSYILDALRRAEAERARGGVPGLHAQPAAGVSVAADDGGRRWPVSALLLVGALLALAGALAALWWRGAAGPAAVTVATPAAPLGAASAVPVAVNPAPVPAPAASVTPTGPLVVVMTAPAAPVAAPVAAVQAPRPGPATPAAGPAPAGLPSGAASAPTAQVAAPAAPAAPARPLTVAELPEPAQRELAALSLGGAVYADQPAARLVIINGQVFHEGDRPTPALQIEQIGLKALVVNLRGQRVTLPL